MSRDQNLGASAPVSNPPRQTPAARSRFRPDALTLAERWASYVRKLREERSRR